MRATAVAMQEIGDAPEDCRVALDAVEAFFAALIGHEAEDFGGWLGGRLAGTNRGQYQPAAVWPKVIGWADAV